MIIYGGGMPEWLIRKSMSAQNANMVLQTCLEKSVARFDHDN